MSNALSGERNVRAASVRNCLNTVVNTMVAVDCPRTGVSEARSCFSKGEDAEKMCNRCLALYRTVQALNAVDKAEGDGLFG